MSQLLDDLMGQLGGSGLDQIGAAIGVDRQGAASAVQSALPLLLGALANNTATEDGAASLYNALGRDHDGGILDDLMGFLGGASGGGGGMGDAILGHILGGRRGAAEEQVARSSGISLEGAGRLLAILAPILMGLLGRNQRSGGLDVGGLAGLLGRERDAAAERSPDLFGMLGQVLDTNRDGSMLDDAARLGAGLLGGLLKGR
ncbi:MAG TPA: DUF937 domain-containing protein [Thermoanaerobaculia bacterium]|nr:DUF937 domain-containing protein [Thermoanaerobaculia bacterium]